MRIVGGTRRGLRLAAVGRGDAAAHLRPTSDRVRESLFNILVAGRFGDRVAGARVLDLFAGTGALGLEALSRGAAFVTFVETGTAALGLLARNRRLCDAEESSVVLRADATRLGVHTGPPHDLVFLDPPYGQQLGEAALIRARARDWLARGAMVVWEERAPQAAPPGFVARDTRRYGTTTITFLEVQ